MSEKETQEAGKYIKEHGLISSKPEIGASAGWGMGFHEGVLWMEGRRHTKHDLLFILIAGFVLGITVGRSVI